MPAAAATVNDSDPALAAEQLREQVASGRTHSVIMGFASPHGLRGKVFDAGFFLDKVLDRGAHASAYLATADADMRFLPGFDLVGPHTGGGDFLLMPDVSTLRPAGWTKGTALVLADALGTERQPIAVTPRAVLANQARRLGQCGVAASLGLEAEALVYAIASEDAQRRGYRDLPPVGQVNGDYALDHSDAFIGLLEALRRATRASGLRLEGIKTEAGLGQLELTFQHDDPLKAADAHSVYKLLAHRVARGAGMTLTFMAKPYTALDGNSCHLHLSLRTADGEGLVDRGGRLTEFGRHAVAGALAVLGDLAVLMLPYPNSYKRVHADPPLFAPSTLTWGYDNRTTAIRVVGRGAHGHLECRIPGADAQPHLAAAALLAACRYGIREQLELSADPVTGNAYEYIGVPRLPSTLDEAATRFADSPLAAELLGGDVVGHYAAAAGHEIAYYRGEVTDVERARGFERA
jgi:glutamine synthetase